MSDIPLERIWRDARIERIWEGTSEIQRHIISRSLLRPLGLNFVNLNKLFRPKKLAIIGGYWADFVYDENIKITKGEIWHINPKRKSSKKEILQKYS